MKAEVGIESYLSRLDEFGDYILHIAIRHLVPELPNQFSWQR